MSSRTTTCRRSSSRAPPVRREETEELEARAIRYLGLAGERALSLDVDRAEPHLAQSARARPGRPPRRASLLERWAQAAQQQGRLQEARQALEEALALYREPGATLSPPAAS